MGAMETYYSRVKTALGSKNEVYQRKNVK